MLSLSCIGPITQCAFLVRDLNEAVRDWTNRGVGPFALIEKPIFSQYDYRGDEIDIHISAAIAFSGGMQIELIRQVDDAPSVFNQSALGDRFGLHHLATVVDDLDDALIRVAAAGGERHQGGSTAFGDRVAYCVGACVNEPYLEILQPSPETVAFMAAVRAAADQWDGKRALIEM